MGTGCTASDCGRCGGEWDVHEGGVDLAGGIGSNHLRHAPVHTNLTLDECAAAALERIVVNFSNGCRGVGTSRVPETVPTEFEDLC